MAAALAFAALACLAELPAEPSPREKPRPIPLSPGSAWRGEVEAGTLPDFGIRLAAGDALHAVVEQEGIDLLVSLVDPAGAEVAVVDSPNADRGPEPLWAVAAQAGLYRLELRSFAAQGRGRIRVSIEAPRPASAADHWRAEGSAALARGERAAEVARGAAGDAASDRRREAAVSFRYAARRFARAGERRGEALGRYGQGRELMETDLDQSATSLGRALSLSAAAGLSDLLPAILNELGIARSDLGDPAAARDLFVRAQKAARDQSRRHEEASALNNLGLLDDDAGAPWLALDELEAAAAIYRDLSEDRARAVALHNVGRLYLKLGRYPEAEDALRAAANLEAAAGDRRALLATRIYLARAETWDGRTAAARDRLAEALAASRRLGSQQQEAATLDALGTLDLETDRPGRASIEYARAVALSADGGRREDEARALNNLAKADLALGLSRAAWTLHDAARSTFRQLGFPADEAEAMAGRARARRAQGNLLGALDDAARAVGLVEGLWRAARADRLRTDYLASVHGFYELEVDLEMSLALVDPGRGWERRALSAAETGRARTLLAILAESRRYATADETVRRAEEKRLAAAVRSAQGELWRLEVEPARGGRPEAPEARIRTLLDRLERVQVHGRLAAGPREVAKPLSAEAIEGLVDEDSVLLIYSLGERRSFLFRVETGRLSTRVLASRRELEGAARQLHRLLDGSSRPGRPSQLRLLAGDLSEMLLGGALSGTVGKRLVFVPDGALAYVPFGLLPVAGGAPAAGLPWRPLLVDHEIVELPSASVLASVRHRLAGQRPAPGLLAVLADPVFSPEDRRVHGAGRGAASRGLPLAALRGALGGPALRRLSASGAEAAAILSLAPDEPLWAGLGFGADRRAVLAGALGRSRIVHLATHALLSPRQPELSGIVLSLVDRAGRPVDGFLRSYEIADLDLSADLVVLSACRSGLGEERAGEGLVGLPQSFLAAGAARVVVNLWDVNDRAAAHLMARFYEGLFRRGLAPGAALRRAQLGLARGEAFGDPRFWAGFVLLGEWRPLRPVLR